jgi:hypothetical protein
MSLDTLIADTRQAIDDAAAVFTAQGTLAGVTEVDVSTGARRLRVAGDHGYVHVLASASECHRRVVLAQRR